MMLVVNGTFLVCGGTDDPALHILTPEQVADHYRRDTLASERGTSRRLVNRYAFGVDALYSFPAWSRDCMLWVAQYYEGADATLVRGMAAAIALGRTDATPVGAPSERATVAPSAPASGKPRGGRPVRPVSPSPAPATPGGGFFDTL